MAIEVDQFVARSDDGLHEETIVVYQETIEARSRSTPHGTIPGMREARTIDERACNRLNDDEFEVDGIVLKRVQGH